MNRPFFSYYGAKWRATPHYPVPLHDTIVEPFAGAAGYSTRYSNRNVVLCDLDPIIVGIWHYLLRSAPDEILSLPDIGPNEIVDDLNVCQEARWLIGFWLNGGAASPKKTPSKWMRDNPGSSRFWGPILRQRLALQVDSIRHWRVYHCSYNECPVSGTATWFVDPPYQNKGVYYTHGSSSINYEELGAWCRTRDGQVIVCENTDATWLPFRHLAETKTARNHRKSHEVVWFNNVID